MADAPRRVFLSHAREFRAYPAGHSFLAAAESAVKRARDIVCDMEYFAARDEKPESYCRRQVAACDLYVGIIGFRYGSSVRALPDLSYTELEFEVATERGIPRLVFLLDDDAHVPVRMVTDVGERQERQTAFRRRLEESGLIVRTFSDPKDLELKLFQALEESRRDPPEAPPPPVISRQPTPINYSPPVFDQALHTEEDQEL